MKALAIVVAIVILLAALKAAASIVIPLLLAIAISVAFQPISKRLARMGLPPIVASVVTILGVLALLAAFGFLTALAARDLAEGAPRYAETFQQLLDDVQSWMKSQDMDALATRVDGVEPGGYVASAIGDVVVALGGVAEVLFNVLILTAFIQVEAHVLSDKLHMILPPASAERTESALAEVQTYLRVKFLLSLLNGVLLGGWCWVLGVSNPLLWGVVAFAFNWVPLIGAVIAGIPPFVLATVEIGIGGAVALAAGYVVVNIAVDNILEARLMGRAMDISPLVLMMSLLLWGFVLGPIGALLSVPLTVAVRIFLDHHERTRWIALLLAHGTEGYENVKRPVAE